MAAGDSQPATRNPSSAKPAHRAAENPRRRRGAQASGRARAQKSPGPQGRRKAANGRLAARGGGSRPRSRDSGRPERKPRPTQGAQARAEDRKGDRRKPADGRRTGQTNCGGSTDHGARKRAHGRGERAAAGGPGGGRGERSEGENAGPRPRSGNGRAAPERAQHASEATRARADAKCAKRPGDGRKAERGPTARATPGQARTTSYVRSAADRSGGEHLTAGRKRRLSACARPAALGRASADD